MAAGIAYLTLGQVVANVCLFLANLAIIHFYGPAMHGGVVLIVSAASLVIVLSDLGLASKAGVRAIARQRETDPAGLSRIVSGLVTVQIVVAVILGGALMLLAGPLAAHWPQLEAWPLRLAGTWVILYAITRAYMMIAIGLEHMAGVLAISVIQEVPKLLVVIAVGVAKLDVIWIYAGWTASYVISLAVAGFGTYRLEHQFAIRVRPWLGTMGQTLRMLREALPYYVPYLGVFGLPFVMQLAIGFWHPQQRDQVSIFQVCFALALVSRMVAVPIATALFPRVTRIDASAGADHGQTADMLDQAGRWLGLMGTFLFAAYWAFGSPAMTLVYGPTYALALPTLLILTAGIALENYAEQLDQILMAMNYVRIVAWLEAMRYIVLAGLAIWLVPAYRALGAAEAVCLAAMANVVMEIIAVRLLLLKSGKLSRIGAMPFVYGLVVLAAVTAAGSLPHGQWLVIPAWLATALIVRLLRPTEVRQTLGLLTSAMRR